MIDKEYFVIFREDNPNISVVAPTPAAVANMKNIIIGEPVLDPLVFESAEPERFEEEGREEYVPPILFAGAKVLITSTVKEGFEFIGAKGLQYFPAVYVDSQKEWHEDYWYIFAEQDLDLWDRENSDYKRKPEVEDYRPTLITISLNEERVKTIPIENRLFFYLSGAKKIQPLIHKSIIDYFQEGGVTGYQSFSLAEYELGMEF